MNADRWQKIDEIFHRASLLGGDERLRFLDQACASDPSLRPELDALLRADDAPTPVLRASAGEAFSALLAETPTKPIPGHRIGVYELIEEIGSGGMGDVWLARRADAEYEKRVAIKFLRPGRDGETMVRRFLQERQTLATLDHPNIVRMLDGGTTDDGLVYFVTEYIEGQRIDAYSDAQNLPTHERLQLFLAVCSAVQYAHQRLIVHRDLKPSNILVTADGVPKLLDFGIAKLLHGETAELDGDPPKADSLDGTTLPTQPGSRPMTPYYASPEQVRGEQVTTASDVYSLGVVLYELLTGHGPYRLQTWTSSEIEWAVCEEEPVFPSAAAGLIEDVPSTQGDGTIALTPESISRTREGSPASLRRRLTGDLDAILVKALRKQPGDRYHSVAELSQDVQRYLQSLPVLARPPALSYRAGKFILRNRAGAIAAALAIISLVGGIAGVMRQARIASRERDAAVVAQAFAEAQRILAEENVLRAQTAEQVAEAAKVEAETEARTAKEVSEFLVSIFSSSNPGSQNPSELPVRQVLDWGALQISSALRNEPLVQAALMDVIGRVYVALGLYDIAAPLLENALATRRRVLGEEHTEVAASLHSLGRLLQAQGKYQEAESIIRECVAMRRKLFGEDHLDTAASLNNLATLYSDQGKYGQAEQLSKQALAIQEKTLGPDHSDVANSLNNLAGLYSAQGKYDEAESLHKRALAIQEKALGTEHPDVANGLNNLAALYNAQGKYDQAEPMYKRALANWDKVLGPEHPEVATNLNNLAELYHTQGKYDQAEPLHNRALAIREKALGPEHPSVATSLNNLATLYSDQGKDDQAEPLYKRALAIWEKVLGPDHPRVATSLNNLAMLYKARGKCDQAEPLQKRALAIDEKALGPDHPSVATDLNNLADLYHTQGKYDQAEPLYKRALAIQEKALGPEHPSVATSLNNLAMLCSDQTKYDQAEPLHKRALAIREKVVGPEHPDVGQSLNNLALLYKTQGKYDQVEPLYKRALAIQEKALGPDHPSVATNLNNLAMLYSGQGKYDHAEPLYKRALAIWAKALGPDHPNVATVLENYAALLKDMKKQPESDRLLQRAQGIRARKP